MLRTHVERAILLVLLIGLVGSGIYWAGTLILKSVHSSTVLDDYRWIVIGLTIAHAYNLTQKPNQKASRISLAILASTLVTGTAWYCIRHNGDILQAAFGILIYLSGVLVYHLIESKILFKKLL